MLGADRAALPAPHGAEQALAAAEGEEILTPPARQHRGPRLGGAEETVLTRKTRESGILMDHTAGCMLLDASYTPHPFLSICIEMQWAEV